MKTVNVNTEWGRLTETILGTSESLTVPLWTSEYEFAPKKEQEFVKAYGGQSLATAAPERLVAIEEQLNGLRECLTGLGIVVHTIRGFTNDESQYLSHIRDCSQLLFPRDPILVIGDRIIETAMRDPMERKNRFPIRDVFHSLSNIHYEYLAMPEPSPVIAGHGFGPGPFLEGGDTLLCGRQIFVGCSGHASNDWGIAWLEAYLGSDYIVEKVPLSSSILHLDCALALLKEGLAIACSEAFENGLPDFFKDWEIIDVSLEQASYLACNGLVVDSETVILGEEHSDLIGKVEAVGQNVIPLPFDAVSQFGGAFRCCHHPLIRLDD